MAYMSKNLIWIILIIALFLRLPGLFDSFWLDEAAQALEVTRPWFAQLSIAKDFQPPLLHLYLHLVQYFGTSEWWLRWWGALLPGLLSIYFVYAIGKNMFSTKTGLLAAVFLSTSAIHVFFSQELRPYSLPTFWATLSWWLLTQKKPTTSTWLSFTLATAAGLYSSYLYPFLTLSQLSVALFHRDRLKPLITSLFGAGLLFTPWLPFLYEQLGVGAELRTRLPGWEAVVSNSALSSPLIVAGKFILGLGNLDWNAATILPFLTVVITTILLFILSWRSSNLKLKKQLLLIFGWLSVPFIAAWLVTWFIPIISPKRLLFLLPAWYLLLSAVIAQPSKSRVHTYLAHFVVVTTILLNLLSLGKYYSQPLLQRENWREMHAEITQKYPANQAIAIFGFDEPFAPWIWYDDGQYPTVATGVLATSDEKTVTETLKVVQEYRFVLVFDYLRDLSDPERLIERSLRSLGYSEVDYLDQPHIGFVRVYAREVTTVSQGQEFLP